MFFMLLKFLLVVYLSTLFDNCVRPSCMVIPSLAGVNGISVLIVLFVCNLILQPPAFIFIISSLKLVSTDCCNNFEIFLLQLNKA